MNRTSRIGLFLLITLAIVVYFILRTSDVERLLGWSQVMRTVEVALEDASGLRRGTAVEIAGVKVGEIRAIELEDDRAIARLTVPADMVFKQGAEAVIRSKGVLGERYVALNPGRGAALAEQDRLTAGVPPDLGDITGTIKELADNLVVISENLKQSMVTDAGDNRVSRITANIERLSDILVAMVEENRGNMQITSGQVAELTQALNRDVPALLAELTEFSRTMRGMATGNRESIDLTVDNLASLSENVERATASLTSIASKVDEGQGTIGKLINESETSDKLNTLLDTANESMAEVQGFLNRADELELDLHLRSDYLSEFKSAKYHIGIKISPNENKYYILEGVSIPDELLIEEISQETETTFDPDGNVVSTTVHTRIREPDDFLFTGLLAYKVGPLFLRGGLIEGEGGGGVEYVADSGRLRFTLDGYDFNREGFGDVDFEPHGRFDVSYNFNKSIHVRMGWDDFLQSDRKFGHRGRRHPLDRRRHQAVADQHRPAFSKHFSASSAVKKPPLAARTFPRVQSHPPTRFGSFP